IQMGLAILSVVVLNAFFSLIQEYRAERAVQAISRLVPTNAKVMRDGQLRQVNVAEIVPGDVIALEEGDRVPADIRLTKAFEISVDNSVLTGESDPQRRFATMAQDTPVHDISDYQNIVFAGTTIVSGLGNGVALCTGSNTQFGKIVSLSRGVEERKSPPKRNQLHCKGQFPCSHTRSSSLLRRGQNTREPDHDREPSLRHWRNGVTGARGIPAHTLTVAGAYCSGHV
ncbi:cation-transporting P-type ATPase, partial [bacterium]